MNTLSTRLYIIGNGFDLWHGIPSGYEDFKKYVDKHDSRVSDDVERYLAPREDWKDLEAALANLDVDSIIDDMGQFMGGYGDDDWSDAGHHDFQYEVENVVARLSSKLRALFGAWIRTLVIPTPATATRRLNTIDTHATFLNFNYTATLRDLYAVPDGQILHIHGEASEPDSELILGHAWNPSQREPLHRPEDEEEMDIRLIEAHGILDDYFSSTFKPSERLIREHQGFFDQLSAVQQVYVLGHSLSEVDLPYLQVLTSVPSVRDAHWCVACRREDERPERQQRLIELGVHPQRAKTALWSDY